MYERGKPLECRAMVLRSLELCDQMPSDTSALRADIEVCLNATCCMLVEPNCALEHSEKALELRQAAKQRGLKLGYTHHERGRALSVAGRLEEALQQTEVAIQIYEQSGVESPCMQLVLKAEVLNYMKRCSEAADIMMDHLAYRERTIGADDFGSLRFVTMVSC